MTAPVAEKAGLKWPFDENVQLIEAEPTKQELPKEEAVLEKPIQGEVLKEQEYGDKVDMDKSKELIKDFAEAGTKLDTQAAENSVEESKKVNIDVAGPAPAAPVEKQEAKPKKNAEPAEPEEVQIKINGTPETPKDNQEVPQETKEAPPDNEAELKELEEIYENIGEIMIQGWRQYVNAPDSKIIDETAHKIFEKSELFNENRRKGKNEVVDFYSPIRDTLKKIHMKFDVMKITHNRGPQHIESLDGVMKEKLGILLNIGEQYDENLKVFVTGVIEVLDYWFHIEHDYAG